MPVQTYPTAPSARPLSRLLVAVLALATLAWIATDSRAQDPDGGNQPEPPQRPLEVVTRALPSGAVTTPYHTRLVAFTPDGTTVTLWVVEDGKLPAGLELEPETGILSGTPTEAGEFAVTVSVRNSKGERAWTREPLRLRIDRDPLEMIDMPPPDMDGTVKPDSEWAGTAPIRFANGRARVYVRQYGGALHVGFIVNEPYLMTNKVRVYLAPPDLPGNGKLPRAMAFTLEPFNPANRSGHSVGTVLRRGRMAEQGVSWLFGGTNTGFLGVADACNRSSWHAEIKINISAAHLANAEGNMPAYILAAFAVVAADGRESFWPPKGANETRAPVEWLTPVPYRQLRSADFWGVKRDEHLVTRQAVLEVEQPRATVGKTLDERTRDLATAERLLENNRANWNDLQDAVAFEALGISDLLTHHDRNGDGRIERAEWARDPDIFTGIDANKDDVLTHDEMSAFTEKRRQKLLGAFAEEHRKLLDRERKAREIYNEVVKLVVQTNPDYHALTFDVARRYAQVAERSPGLAENEITELWRRVLEYCAVTRAANPYFLPALLLTAQAYVKLGNYERAVGLFDQLVVDEADNAAVLLDAARIRLIAADERKREYRVVAAKAEAAREAGDEPGAKAFEMEAMLLDSKATRHEEISRSLLDGLAARFAEDGSGPMLCAAMLYELNRHELADRQYLPMALAAATEPGRVRLALELVALLARKPHNAALAPVAEQLGATHGSNSEFCRSLSATFRARHEFDTALAWMKRARQVILAAHANARLVRPADWGYRLETDVDVALALANAGQFTELRDYWLQFVKDYADGGERLTALAQSIEAVYADVRPQTEQQAKEIAEEKALRRNQLTSRLATALLRFDEFRHYAGYWADEQAARQAPENATNPRVIMTLIGPDGSEAEVELEMFRRDTPTLVDYILNRVKDGRYNPDWRNQGGKGARVDYHTPASHLVIGVGEIFSAEARIEGESPRKHFRGSVSLVPIEGSDYGPPFAIDTGLNPAHNGPWPVIGRVVSGMEHVDAATNQTRVRLRMK